MNIDTASVRKMIFARDGRDMRICLVNVNKKACSRAGFLQG
ncbi:hypothetical protein [Klebsiella spallanzanii]|nr:hypothetical protein [Klebsiella spallanzanii]MDM4207881.1 hypothetical protein [Klebsiella spallanzanii]